MGSAKEVLNYYTSLPENAVLSVDTFLEFLEKMIEEMRENKCAKILAEHIANGKDIDFRLENMMCYEDIHNALLNPSQYLSPEILKREYGDNYKDKEKGGRLPPIPFMIYTDVQTNQIMVITREEDRAIVDEILKDSIRVSPRVSENKLNEINKNGQVLEVSNLSSNEHKAFTIAAKKLGLTYSETREDENNNFNIRFSASSKEDIYKANLCINKTVLDTVGYSAPKYLDFHSEKRMRFFMDSVMNAKEEFVIASATSPKHYIKVTQDGAYLSQVGKDKFVKKSEDQFVSLLYSKIENLNAPVICTNEEFKNWNANDLFKKAFVDMETKLTPEQERIASLEQCVKTLYDFKSSFALSELSQNLELLKNGSMPLEEYFKFDKIEKDDLSSSEILKIANGYLNYIKCEASETEKAEMKEYIINLSEQIDLLKEKAVVYQIDEQDIQKSLKDILKEMDVSEQTKAKTDIAQNLENVKKPEEKE